MADRPTHDPWIEQTFHKGASTDIDPDLLGREKGLYVDSQNMRPTSVDGATGALERIGGEQIKYPLSPTPGAGSYICIGTIMVNDHIVEFWASPLAGCHPIIRIDGIIMALSALLPYTFDHPLQIEKAEDCVGGVIMPLDDNSIPMLFNVQDIIDSFGTDKYFAGFNPAEYQINAPAPNDRPRYYGLTSVGGGGGMFPGDYYYSIRYVNVAGDRTNIGPEVGPVYVPRTLGPQGSVNDAQGFPGASLTGGSATDIGIKGPYAVRLKVRVNNLSNYDRIELIRTEINEGQGLNSVPKRYVAAQIPISPQQISVVTIIDTGERIELIPQDEEETQRLFILKAKSPRYIEGRMALGNIEVATREIQVDFVDGTNPVFAFTKNIGIFGHSDPVNHCYYRRFRGGEQVGLGIQWYDYAMGKSFVTPMPGTGEGWTAPNRRNPKFGDDLTYSDASLYAANTFDEITPTYEAFDIDNAVSKTNRTRFVNIMIDGSRTVTVTGVVGPLPTPAEQAAQGLYVSGIDFKTSFTQPLRPTGPTDADKFGHDYQTTIGCRPILGDTAGNPSELYAPKVFQPEFHTLGAAFRGFTNIPDGVTGFSIVGTKPAGRVVMQGLATYAMDAGVGTAPATKQTGVMSCFFPEADAGLIDQTILDDFIANPQNYRVLMVSPVGISSELYNAASAGQGTSSNDPRFGYLTDMMSYARVLWDTGQVNPQTGTGGYHPSGPGPVGDNYVGYGRWRQTTTPPNLPWQNDVVFGGDHQITITSVTTGTDTAGGSVRYNLALLEAPYANGAPAANKNFTDPQTQAFHEPWYVINIVRAGAEIDTSEGYRTLNHYQKMVAIIGVGNATEDQAIRLIDERDEDAVGYLLTDYRYVYVTPPGAPEQAWLCQTGNTDIDIPTILGDITGFGFWTAPDGTHVHGLYSASTSTDQETVLNFGLYGPASVLPDGSIVRVKYNWRTPVKAYGDTFISPAMVTRTNKLAKITNVTSLGSDPVAFVTESAPGFRLNSCPMPYAAYDLNPRYYPAFSAAAPNAPFWPVQPWSLRQWAVLFDCESRLPLQLNVFTDEAKSFPNIQYVMRPYVFDDTATLAGNGVFDGYGTIYPNENLLWYEGGIKADQKVNFDYAYQRDVQFFKKPNFFRERTDFCNAIAYSEKVNPLDQDSPGFKTYPATNIYFIESNTGGIRKLWSANANSYGYNLYAFTADGVVLLPTSKSVAYSADGQSFALTRNDEFLSKDIWLTKNIGMPDEFWRMCAEGHVPNGGGYEDTIFWADRKGVYRMTSNQITEISRGKYFTKLFPFLKNAPSDFSEAQNSMWNPKQNEYWMGITSNGTKHVFVYAADPNVNNWAGEFTYAYDQFLADDTDLYGMRQLSTWDLDTGNLMLNAPFQANVMTVISNGSSMAKEPTWYRINSSVKPSEVQFFDRNKIFACRILENNLLNIDGYQQAVSRTETSYSPVRDRLQSVYIYVKVIHQKDEDFKMSTQQVQIHEMK